MQGRADTVDGLPTWIRWIIVVVVDLSPMLTFWMAGVLWRYVRYRRGGGDTARRARLARQEQRDSDDEGGQPDRR